MYVATDSFSRERRLALLESRNQGLAKSFSNAQNKKGLMLEHQASRKSVNEKVWSEASEAILKKTKP
jgi:hypothetical protein